MRATTPGFTFIFALILLIVLLPGILFISKELYTASARNRNRHVKASKMVSIFLYVFQE